MEGQERDEDEGNQERRQDLALQFINDHSDPVPRLLPFEQGGASDWAMRFMVNYLQFNDNNSA
jgi:hypothetical protein